MSKLSFIQMVGIPGSGKTEMANRLAAEYDAVVFSSDTIRKKLTGNESDQTMNDKVFKEMSKRTCKTLDDGISVVHDATNLSYKRRRALLEQLSARYDVQKIAVVMATPIKICIDRQEHRERVISQDIIWKMVKSFYVPYWYEGWDDIRLVYPENDEKYTNQLYRNDITQLHNGTSLYFDFDQKNPHHDLFLGDHMVKCYELMCKSTFVGSLREAALIHDIGKFFTQSFDDKGIAHYYGHQNVSAYLSLFNRDRNESCFKQNGFTENQLYNRIQRAAYVQWHMAPYFWKEEKTYNRYKRLLGDHFYYDLLLLHKCDKEAHQ